MSVRTDVVNLLVNVGGDKAKDQLNQLRKTAAELNSEMKGLSKNSTEFKEKSKELAQVNDRMASLRKTIGLTALSQKELVAELKRLQQLKNIATPQTKEFNELQKSIDKVSGRLWEVKNGVFGVSAVFKKLKDEIGGFGVGALAALGAQFIMGKISGVIDGAGKLSDQLSDLRRVTGMTASEADNLNSSLKKIDSRTSNSGLRDIAITAGKLGVATDEIASFTKEVDKLVVTLGDELGDADAITTALGKILNVFDGKVTGENISFLGNAIVELANAGVASGGFISDFTQRVAGIAKSSNLSLGATVGLAAGFEELGLRSESSATALQKLLMTIASDVPKAAQIAGMEFSEFNALFASSPQEALIKYGEGLVKNKQSFSEITSSFKDAGEEGARVVQTLQLLGQSGDFLRTKIDLGNESIQSATGINEAFAIKNENLAATVAKMGKEFDKLMTSSAVTEFLKGAITATSDLINGLIQLPKWLNENKALIILMAGAVGVYTRARTAQFLLDSKDLILKGLLLAQEKASFLLFGAQLYLTKAYTLAKGLLTGQITLATVATRAFNVASTSLSGIVGIIITVISVAAAAYSSFSTKVKESGINLSIWSDLMKEASQNAGKEIAQMKLLFNAVNDINKPIEERRENYEKLQKLYPQILGNMSFEEAAAGRLKNKYEELTKAIMGKYIVQASESQFAKLGEELMKVEQQISTAKNALDLIKAQSNQLGVSPGSNPQELSQTGNLKRLEKQKAIIEANFQDLQKFIEGMKEKYGQDATLDGTGVPSANTSSTSSSSDSKASTTKINNAQSAAEKEIDIQKKLREELLSLQEEYNAKSESNDAYELAKLDEKFKKLQARAKGNRENELLAEEVYYQAVHALILKWKEREKKAIEDANNKIAESEKQAALDKLKTIEENGERLSNALLAGADKDIERYLASIEERNQLEQELLEARKQMAEQAYNLVGSFTDYLNQRDQQNLNKELAGYDKRKEHFRKMLESNRISQAQYDIEIEKIDKKAAKRKHEIAVKELNRHKLMASMAAVMNTAEGVTKALTLPSPFNFIVAGLVGAAGLVQVGTINSQEVPVAEKGMLIKGKRHSEGGTMIEAEDGEMILSRNTVANNPGLASALLFSSQNKNGAPIQYNWSNPSISTNNMQHSFGRNNSTTSGGSFSIEALVAEQRTTNAILAQFPKTLKAYTTFSDIQDASNLYNQAKNEGSLKQ